jgi:hypothetical protein
VEREIALILRKPQDRPYEGKKLRDDSVEGEEYEAEEIATGFALATTSSDCRVLLLKDSQ